MAKLYFKYGAMGSSKSAQALITKFNYEEKGMTVWLIKPGTDTRDGADIIKSRENSKLNQNACFWAMQKYITYGPEFIKQTTLDNKALVALDADKLLQDIKTLYIDDICVDEKARGHHVGKALYEHVRDYAKSIGCNNITLNVWEGNSSAISFYKNMGMNVQKTTMEIIIKP